MTLFAVLIDRLFSLLLLAKPPLPSFGLISSELQMDTHDAKLHFAMSHANEPIRHGSRHYQK